MNIIILLCYSLSKFIYFVININNQEIIVIIFKIEYTSPDFKIPIIEYALFGVFGKKRLNIFVCKDMKIMYNIPIFVIILFSY